MKVKGLTDEITPEMFRPDRRPYVPGAIAAWNRVIANTESEAGVSFVEATTEAERAVAFFMFVAGYRESKIEEGE